MFKIKILTKYFYLERGRLPVSVIFILFNISLFSQNTAFVNNGCNIYVQGPGSLTANPTISIHGSYLNLYDGQNHGTIEEVGGNIWLDSNWINNAGNNVFTNNTGSNTDGFVTFHNTKSVQYIDGTTPTHFENLFLNDYRKQLLNNNNLVNGVLYLDAALILNSFNFIINNPNPLSISYISGFIKSETLPGNYSTLQWNIGSALGTFKIPFGSDIYSFNDLNLTVNLKTPIGPGDYMSFATYPADMYNLPLPTTSSPLELEPRKVADRYWILSPSNPLNKPTCDITFTFSGNDIDNAHNSIDRKLLKASRNNTDIGKWLDMKPRGTVAGNTVTIHDVTPAEFYEPWTLVNIPGSPTNVFVPDAFTPDGDGLNDVFKPTFKVDFVVTSYEFIIFNRWGEEVFHTTDPDEGWNGRKHNNEGEPVIDVYSWVIIVKGQDIENNDDDYRKRIVGMVTLYK